tara:strand:+ start:1131 stop:2303 length:1173 start_codon:yes stop_codon:yes gene_type:complete
MINPNNFRPSFELNLFNDLLKNSSFNKASESHLKKISLDHSQKNTLDFLTNGIRINDNNSPLLYKTFNEIKKKLAIGRLNVDLFIENDPSINAGLAFIKKSNYIVFLNSGLMNLLNLDEIKFVIGHELGHLKYQHHRIIKNPNKKSLPIFTVRLFEHSRYAEISADRCGLVGVGSLNTAKSALLKIATGTDLQYLEEDSIGVNVQINDIKNILKSDEGLIDEKLSHPYSLIRIHALEKFNNFIEGKSVDLKKIDDSLLKLLSYLNPKMNNKKSILMVYACFWVSYSDKKNLKIEKDNIEGICDPVILNKIDSDSLKIKNKLKYFRNNFIRKYKEFSGITLSDKSDILDKVCSVAMADGKIQDAEINAMKDIAREMDILSSYVDSLIKKLK